MDFFLSSPTSNNLWLAYGDGSGVIKFTDLLEPIKIPEMDEDILWTPHQMRPGQLGGGNRTGALYPASANKGHTNFTLPLVTPTVMNTIKGWRRRNPPTSRFTNDGGLNWYYGILIKATPESYDLNQRVFCKVNCDFLSLGKL